MDAYSVSKSLNSSNFPLLLSVIMDLPRVCHPSIDIVERGVITQLTNARFNIQLDRLIPRICSEIACYSL